MYKVSGVTSSDGCEGNRIGWQKVMAVCHVIYVEHYREDDVSDVSQGLLIKSRILRHQHRRRLARHAYILTSDTHDFLARM